MGKSEKPGNQMFPEDGAESNGHELLFQDMSCWICGYSLTGLKPDSHCPECGKPIQETITDLKFADRNWLKLTGWGLIAQTLLTGFPLAGVLIYSTILFSSGFLASYGSLYFILNQVWRNGGLLLHLGTAILLTWPRSRNVPTSQSLRWITITLAVTHILSSQLSYFLQYPMIDRALVLATISAAALGHFCHLLYVSKFLLRCSRQLMARAIMTIAVMGLAVWIRNIIAQFVKDKQGFSFDAGLFDILANFAILTSIVMLIITYLILRRIDQPAKSVGRRMAQKIQLDRVAGDMCRGLMWIQGAFLVFAIGLRQNLLGADSVASGLIHLLLVLGGIAIPAYIGGRHLLVKSSDKNVQQQTNTYDRFHIWLTISLITICVGELVGRQWIFLAIHYNFSSDVFTTPVALIIFWQYWRRRCGEFEMAELGIQFHAMGAIILALTLGYLVIRRFYFDDSSDWQILQIYRYGIMSLCIWTAVLLGVLRLNIQETQSTPSPEPER